MADSPKNLYFKMLVFFQSNPDYYNRFQMYANKYDDQLMTQKTQKSNDNKNRNINNPEEAQKPVKKAEQKAAYKAAQVQLPDLPEQNQQELSFLSVYSSSEIQHVEDQAKEAERFRLALNKPQNNFSDVSKLVPSIGNGQPIQLNQNKTKAAAPDLFNQMMNQASGSKTKQKFGVPPMLPQVVEAQKTSPNKLFIDLQKQLEEQAAQTAKNVPQLPVSGQLGQSISPQDPLYTMPQLLCQALGQANDAKLSIAKIKVLLNEVIDKEGLRDDDSEYFVFIENQNLCDLFGECVPVTEIDEKIMQVVSLVPCEGGKVQKKGKAAGNKRRRK